MADILYAPNQETVVTSNAWAFMHWLRAVHGTGLDDWTALQRFSAEHPGAFGTAIARFARLPNAPLRLASPAQPLEPAFAPLRISLLSASPIWRPAGGLSCGSR